MSISILVEPSRAGFRATTGGPLDLSAEADSAAAALAELQAMIDLRLSRGAVIVQHSTVHPPMPFPPDSLADNPLFDAWQDAIAKYREEKEIEDRAVHG